MKKLQFVFILTTLLTTPTISKEEESRFSREVVEEMISSGNIRSVEDFLEALAQSDKRVFFENYVLMFHSRSLQGASFQSPRAIMFSANDEFVMAFTGDGTQREIQLF